MIQLFSSGAKQRGFAAKDALGTSSFLHKLRRRYFGYHLGDWLCVLVDYTIVTFIPLRGRRKIIPGDRVLGSQRFAVGYLNAAQMT